MYIRDLEKQIGRELEIGDHIQYKWKGEEKTISGKIVRANKLLNTWYELDTNETGASNGSDYEFINLINVPRKIRIGELC